jgi:hypothetical protein
MNDNETYDNNWVSNYPCHKITVDGDGCGYIDPSNKINKMNSSLYIQLSTKELLSDPNNIKIQQYIPPNTMKIKQTYPLKEEYGNSNEYGSQKWNQERYSNQNISNDTILMKKLIKADIIYIVLILVLVIGYLLIYNL